MPRSIHRLTALGVSKAKHRGLYADGGGLYLQVVKNRSKSWIFRYRENRKNRFMGLGSLHTVDLPKARALALEYRNLRLDGIDPIHHRDTKRTEAKLAAAKAIKFDECTERYIEAHKAEWKNKKHRDQWTSTLKTYASPVIGSLPVQSIDVTLVMSVVRPLWNTKVETASRLRGRIEKILDWATAQDLRTGENPARWKGRLSILLPKPAKVHKVEHHPALPYIEIATFLSDLRKMAGISPKALELLIFTALRSGEVRGARWDEFDLDGKIWIVPGERMKSKRPHRVPLSEQSLAVLRHMKEIRLNEFVFPGGKRDQHLSDMALLQTLQRMNRTVSLCPFLEGLIVGF
jgi:integrase